MQGVRRAVLGEQRCAGRGRQGKWSDVSSDSNICSDKTGLLIDCSAQLRLSAPKQYDLLSLLRDIVADAAKDGQPFTKTGLSGLYLRRFRMPKELRISRARLEQMAEDLLDTGNIVACLAPKSTTTKWLDVPGGPFAEGRGSFVKELKLSNGKKRHKRYRNIGNEGLPEMRKSQIVVFVAISHSRLRVSNIFRIALSTEIIKITAFPKIVPQRGKCDGNALPSVCV